MKTLGLALGGGGLKGLAHIGVLQVLHEYGVPITYISGTSSGSIIAALYATGMSPYKMEKIALNLKPSDYLDYNLSGFLKYICSLYVPKVRATLDGLIKGEKIEKLMYKLTDGKRLNEANIPLGIIACNIDTGREIVFSNYDLKINDSQVVIKDALLSQAVRASISIPVTFVPSKFRQMQLVDGGIREIVPVEVQVEMGAEYILAVNLGQELYDKPVKGIPQIVGRTLSILIYETSEEYQKIYAQMVIFPSISNIDLADIDKAAEIIRCGRRAMKQNIDELLKGLNS